MPLNRELLLSQFQFPGMTYAETRITHAWIARHWEEWEQVGFNVRLGRGQEIPEGSDPAVARMIRSLTTLRADVIVERGDRVAILEVKVRIGVGVLGQLLGYRYHWQQSASEERPVDLIAIGRDVLADARPVLESAGVLVEIFPRLTPETDAL